MVKCYEHFALSKLTESAQTGDDSDTLLFATGSSWNTHLLRAVFFCFLCLQNTFATASLTLLLIFTARIFSCCIADFHLWEFIGQILLQPCLTLFVVRIIFAILTKKNWVNSQVSYLQNEQWKWIFSIFLPRLALYNCHSIALLPDRLHLLLVQFSNAPKVLSCWSHLNIAWKIIQFTRIYWICDFIWNYLNNMTEKWIEWFLEWNWTIFPV